MSALAKSPGFTGSGNARLSALRISNEDQFLDYVSKAIKLNHGILVNAASALKVHRNTLTKWIDYYPVLSSAIREAREAEATREASARAR